MNVAASVTVVPAVRWYQRKEENTEKQLYRETNEENGVSKSELDSEEQAKESEKDGRINERKEKRRRDVHARSTVSENIEDHRRYNKAGHAK